jgi:hypothetical protein
MSDLLVAALLDRYAEECPEEPAWEDVLVRARRARRRVVGVAIAVTAVVLVPSALAITVVSHAFEGRTAPPSVVRGFTRRPSMNPAPGVIPYAQLQPVDPKSAHGVLAVRSLDGPLYLWAANESSGAGECWFATWAHDLKYPWTAATAAGCDSPQLSSQKIAYSYSWQIPHWAVAVLVGRTYVNAATVSVRYGCGRTRVLPVVEHLFVTTFVWSTRVFSLTARDRGGRVLEVRRVPWRPSPGGPTAPNSAIRC